MSAKIQSMSIPHIDRVNFRELISLFMRNTNSSLDSTVRYFNLEYDSRRKIAVLDQSGFIQAAVIMIKQLLLSPFASHIHVQFSEGAHHFIFSLVFSTAKTLPEAENSLDSLTEMLKLDANAIEHARKLSCGANFAIVSSSAEEGHASVDFIVEGHCIEDTVIDDGTFAFEPDRLDDIFTAALNMF